MHFYTPLAEVSLFICLVLEKWLTNPPIPSGEGGWGNRLVLGDKSKT